MAAVVARAPRITLDDGADLLSALHLARPDLLEGLLGGTEETTTGLVRLRALEAEGRLACPVLAVNEAITERFNDRFGTGQSAMDGILRTTNLLLAGRTLVVLGYGWTGKGIALRAHGLGASVIICEVDPLRALEARMEGFEVLPALEAAEARRRVRHGDRRPRRPAPGALRADEGRRRARQRRPLRRRDRPRRAARAAPTPRARSARWSSSSCSASAGSTCWPAAASSTWPRPRGIPPG